MSAPAPETLPNPQPFAASGYVEYRFRSGNPCPVARHIKPVMRRLLPVNTKGLRALDIGCGNGHWTAFLHEMGMSVIGLDPSTIGINYAKTNFPGVRFELMLATPNVLNDLREEPFDVAISVEVVEHVQLPREWAAACFAALKPGGTLVCTTPYHGYLKNLTISVLDKWDTHMNPFWDFGHIKLWSRKTLSKLLTDAGFVNVRFGGAGRAPYLWQSMVLAAEKPRAS